MMPQLSQEPIAHGSAFSGLASIFYSPVDAFRPGDRRGWVVPLVAICLMTLVMNFLIIQRVGLETLTRNQLQSNPKLVERIGQAEIDRMSREAGESRTRKLVTYGASLIGPPIVLALVASILLAIVLMTGGVSNFPSMLTAFAYPQYAMMSVTLLAAVITLAATQDYSSFDPRHLVVLNPTLFLDRETTPGPLYSMAESFDLLSVWNVFLIATGVSRLSTDMPFKKTLAAVVVLWLIWVLAKSAFASFF